jgi:5-methylcytosine-specific restriction endonuclease McrA
MEADHIIPVSLGGLGDQSNLRSLCKSCHKAATARLRKLGKHYKA